MSNLDAGSALLQTLHLYRLCFHVCFGALLRRSGSLAEQALHFAILVISLFFLHILKRSASNAEHGNVLRQTTHATLALSSEGFVLSIIGRPPLTPCAPPSALLFHSTLLYSILGRRSARSGVRQGVALPLLFYSNIHYSRVLYFTLLYTKVF